MKRKGQVTIFIILAILVVSVVLIFFLWIQPTYFQNRTSGLNFENCIRDSVEQSIENLGRQAGFVNPEFVYLYNGLRVPYLCYTNLYYETCTVQKPFLKQHFEQNLKNDIRGEVDSCYQNSIENLRAAGYDVREGEVDFEISLEPGIVKIIVEAPTRVGSQNFAKFNIGVNSPIYEIVMIATSIVQYESKYGDSDTGSLMIFYPDMIITKLRRGDSTKIYSIEDKNTQTKFQFASKSLVWPEGYGV